MDDRRLLQSSHAIRIFHGSGSWNQLMVTLSTLLIGKPLNILAIAAVFFAGYLLVTLANIGPGRHPRSLLVVVGAWTLYAAWEWIVLVRTPEANIRVDLLLIWPLVLIVSIWFIIRAFR